MQCHQNVGYTKPIYLSAMMFVRHVQVFAHGDCHHSSPHHHHLRHHHDCIVVSYLNCCHSLVSTIFFFNSLVKANRYVYMVQLEGEYESPIRPYMSPYLSSLPRVTLDKGLLVYIWLDSIHYPLHLVSHFHTIYSKN